MLAYFKDHESEIVALLTELVKHESFTRAKEHVDALADYITDFVEPLNPTSITRIPQHELGDFLLVRWHEDAPGKPIMVLMHMDTVHPIGTLNQFPLQTDDEGRLFGPGILDMKGGIAVALSAVRGLVERDELPNRPIWFLFTSDEEIGSPNSAAYIEQYAPQCGLALVMEFPTNEGALKTARKGVATYTLKTTGRPAHAGNHPEEGVNAVLEMARQIIAVSQLQDLRAGISVAVNTVQGGTASNVIAPQAEATIDVRTVTQGDMDRIHSQLMDLHPKSFGAEVEVSLNHMRGPMERDDTIQAAFKQAQALAKSIGLTVYEDSVGGGSDGNITAALGVPTLDGLGPRGAGPHTLNEHVLLRSLPERAAHMAIILRDWQDT